MRRSKTTSSRDAPAVVLPWTTYADSHDLLGPAADTNLADLARRDKLVVYFFPAERGRRSHG
jgi:hypothetical protein